VLDHREEGVAGGWGEVEVVVVDDDVHLAPELREVAVEVVGELVGLLLRPYAHALEVRVDDVVLGVVGDALVEAHRRALGEAHLPVVEDPGVHRADVVGDHGPEGHLGEYVPAQDHPGRQLHDLEPALDQLEDAALGYVVDRLAAPPRVLARERDLPHLPTNLLVPGSSILRFPFSMATLAREAKVPRKYTVLAFWLMFMNPPAPASFVPNRLTFTFPSPSTSAIPRNAWSSPPPS
jgi:hypothetical protein